MGSAAPQKAEACRCDGPSEKALINAPSIAAWYEVRKSNQDAAIDPEFAPANPADRLSNDSPHSRLQRFFFLQKRTEKCKVGCGLKFWPLRCSAGARKAYHSSLSLFGLARRDESANQIPAYRAQNEATPAIGLTNALSTSAAIFEAQHMASPIMTALAPMDSSPVHTT
ncbi:hypothetical protein N7468_005602 [Penicillium chermesinum]|uniref:Uncharacterized protein n=1 Tax=Penicillium chermesinum TaxID=63820 RepID=A0A9W9NZT8_9EURO|nr:uncharacterized protein N7468_005602 [Penicillium chermesinum]KAJ5232646.1 hypothetical protein N7468_005602 [Penicillium chermesinum]